MNPSQLVNTNQFHKLFASLHSFHPFLLVSSVLTYIFSPILGCIPILLFLQIKISRDLLNGININKLTNSSRKTELLSILLVLFATTIYGSTFQVVGDLENMIHVYNDFSKFGFSGLFNTDEINSYKGVEPLTFAIPHILGMILGYNDNHFILIQSFTFNLAFTLIAYFSFPFLYPIIILINITSLAAGGSSLYFFNMFLMRQFYSFIFIIAMALLPMIFPSFLFFVCGYLSHSSAILFSFPLLLMSIPYLFYDINFIRRFKFSSGKYEFVSNFFMKNRLFFILLTFLLLLIFSSVFVLFYVQSSDWVSDKYDFYVYKASNDPRRFTFPPGFLFPNIVPELILFVCISVCLPIYSSSSSSSLLRFYRVHNNLLIISLISLSLIFSYYLFNISYAFLRPLVTLSTLKGFFYALMFDSLPLLKNKILSKIFFLSLVFLSSLSVGILLLQSLYAIYICLIYKYYFPLTSYSYESVLMNNNLPTVANNLIDYLQRFFQLLSL